MCSNGYMVVMYKKIMGYKLPQLSFGICAVLALSALGASSAFAQSPDDVMKQVVESSAELPGLVSALSYLLGLLLGVLGILKIKEHVENPNSAPLRAGVIRLLVGGGLFALPIVYEAMKATLTGGTDTVFDPSGSVLDDILGAVAGIVGWEELPTVSAVLARILEGLNGIPGLLSALGYLLGLIFGVSGLIKLKEHVENPDQTPLKAPVIRFLVGGAFFALPTIYQAMNDAVAINLNIVSGVLDVLTVAGLVLSEYVNPFSGNLTGNLATCIGTGGVGSAICTATVTSGAFPAFLTGMSYIIGLILGFWGILKIKEHVENPQQTSIWEGFSRLIAGGMFLALPVMIRVAATTISPIVATGLRAGQGIYMATGAYHEDLSACGGSFLGFSIGGSDSGGLDSTIGCLMQDIIGPVHFALNLFALTAGIILLMVAISRLTKSAQEGAKGPGGLGTFMTFVTAGALISYNELIRVFTGSLGLGIGGVIGVTRTYGTLEYTTGMTADEIDHAHTIISAIVKLMIVIGLISFVRGLFIVRDVAEGNGQASLMAGMTHIIGGALAVNIGPLINLVQNTLGISGYGIAFS
jgi:hypothetical protein